MEEMAEVATRQQVTPLPPANTIPVFQQPEDGGEYTAATTSKSERTRRRGSLSISRFGQVTRSWSPLIDDVELNDLHPFQIPENSVDIAFGQGGVSRTASAVSSLALKSPLYAQPPVSIADLGGPIMAHSFLLTGTECRLVWV